MTIMIRRARTVLPFTMLTILTGVAVVATVQASSDDAWRDFRGQVQQACTKAAQISSTPFASMVMDDFGTQDDGVALLRQSTGKIVVCVMDKRNQTAQLSGEMTLPEGATKGASAAAPAQSWWQRWFGQ